MVEGVVRRIEQALGRPLPPGQYQLNSRPGGTACGTGFRCMRYTREPLAECHRPLVYYLVLQAAHCLLGGALRLLCGFERRRVGRLHYLARSPAPRTRRPRPWSSCTAWAGCRTRSSCGGRARARWPVLLPLPSYARSMRCRAALAPPPCRPTSWSRRSRSWWRGTADTDAPRRISHTARYGDAGGAASAARGLRGRLVLRSHLLCPPARRPAQLHVRDAAVHAGAGQQGGFARWFHWVQHVTATSDLTVQNAFRREFFWATTLPAPSAARREGNAPPPPSTSPPPTRSATRAPSPPTCAATPSRSRWSRANCPSTARSCLPEDPAPPAPAAHARRRLEAERDAL